MGRIGMKWEKMGRNRDAMRQKWDDMHQKWDDMRRVAPHPLSSDQHPVECEFAFFAAFCYRRPRPLAKVISPTRVKTRPKKSAKVLGRPILSARILWLPAWVADGGCGQAQRRPTELLHPSYPNTGNMLNLFRAGNMPLRQLCNSRFC